MKSTIDYQALWGALQQVIARMGVDRAQRAMTEVEIRKIRHHQGAYQFSRDVLAAMDTLREQALHPANSVDAN